MGVSDVTEPECPDLANRYLYHCRADRGGQ